jgi:hypothetical protein
MQHEIKINGQVHVINSQHGAKLLLNKSKKWAIADMKKKEMIHKHCLSGRFMSVKIKN